MLTRANNPNDAVAAEAYDNDACDTSASDKISYGKDR